jgi:acetyl esterase/lipase
LTDATVGLPRTAPDEEFPSHHEFAEGHLLTRKTILWFHQHYRSSDADLHDFRYAPLICKTLATAPALIIVGECDPLRDDGIAYAERLKRMGMQSNLPTIWHGPPILLDGWCGGCRAARRDSSGQYSQTGVQPPAEPRMHS